MENSKKPPFKINSKQDNDNFKIKKTDLKMQLRRLYSLITFDSI